MAKVLGYRQALKVWFLMVGAILVLIFGGQLSGHVAGNQEIAQVLRWLAVTVGVVCILPWILTVVWSVGAGDEFVRQIVLIGTSIAFVVDLLVHVGFNAAQDAKLVSWSTHISPLPVAIGAWFLGCSIAVLYYRFRP